MTLAEYLEQQSVAGLLVIKDGAIVYERYRLGNDRDSRWISYSVTKSVVSMLVGAAIRDGYIASVDEKVTDYLPRLKGSAYDQASIRDILQMASGVAWDETYDDPESDLNQAILEHPGPVRLPRRQAAQRCARRDLQLQHGRDQPGRQPAARRHRQQPGDLPGGEDLAAVRHGARTRPGTSPNRAAANSAAAASTPRCATTAASACSP